MSNITDFIGGGGGVRLAVDTDYIATSPLTSVTVDSSIGGTTTPQTLLSLTGKFLIDYLYFSIITTTEDIRIVLEIDGVTVWDNTSTHSGATQLVIGSSIPTNNTGYVFSGPGIICNTSLTLKAGTATATNTTIVYSARAIL